MDVFDGFVELDVTDTLEAGLSRGVGHIVSTNVNDHGLLVGGGTVSWLEPFTFDKLRLADGNDNDVRVVQVRSDVAGLGVGDGDGGVQGLQQLRDGRADDVGSTDHDGSGALDGDVGLVEQLDDTLGSAGQEERMAVLLVQLADVGGAEPVHVLLGQHPRGDLVLVQMGGQWQLHNDPVRLRIFVQLVHATQHLELGHRLVQVYEVGHDAGLFGGLALHAHVRGGVWSVTYLDNGQIGREAGHVTLDRFDFGSDIGSELLSTCFAVQHLTSHDCCLGCDVMLWCVEPGAMAKARALVERLLLLYGKRVYI